MKRVALFGGFFLCPAAFRTLLESGGYVMKYNADKKIVAFCDKNGTCALGVFDAPYETAARLASVIGLFGEGKKPVRWVVRKNQRHRKSRQE